MGGVHPLRVALWQGAEKRITDEKRSSCTEDGAQTHRTLLARDPLRILQMCLLPVPASMASLPEQTAPVRRASVWLDAGAPHAGEPATGAAGNSGHRLPH